MKTGIMVRLKGNEEHWIVTKTWQQAVKTHMEKITEYVFEKMSKADNMELDSSHNWRNCDSCLTCNCCND